MLVSYSGGQRQGINLFNFQCLIKLHWHGTMILRWFTATPTFFHSTVTNLDRSQTFTDMNLCNITLITTSAIFHPTSLPFCRELDFFPSQTILLLEFHSWSSNLYFGSLDSPYCQWFEFERVPKTYKFSGCWCVSWSSDPSPPCSEDWRSSPPDKDGAGRQEKSPDQAPGESGRNAEQGLTVTTRRRMKRENAFRLTV